MSQMSIDIADDNDTNKEDNKNLAPKKTWVWGDDSSNDDNKSMNTNKNIPTNTNISNITNNKNTNQPNRNNKNNANATDNTSNNSNSASPNNNASNTFAFGGFSNNNNNNSISNNGFTFDTSNNTTNNNNNNVQEFIFGSSNTNTNNISFNSSNNDNNGSINDNISDETTNTNKNDDTTNHIAFDIPTNTNNNTKNEVSFGIPTNDNNDNKNNNATAWIPTSSTPNTNTTTNDNNSTTGWTLTPNTDTNTNNSGNTSTATGWTPTFTPNTNAIPESTPIFTPNTNKNNTTESTPMFGTQNNEIESSDNNNDNNAPGWTPTFSTPNNSNNPSNNSKQSYIFGTPISNTDSNIPTTDPFNSSSFQPISNNNDPFASFTAKQPPIKSSITKPKPLNNPSHPQPHPPIPISPIIINESDIDHEAQAAFLSMYNEQNKNTWICHSCNVKNDMIKNKCDACDEIRKDISSNNNNNKIEEDIMDMDNGNKNDNKIEEDVMDMDDNKNDNKNNNNNFEYYNILNKNNEILEYNIETNPIPKYFPYDHDEKNKELIQEGDSAWTQFDDSDDDNSDNDDDIKVNDNDNVNIQMDVKVKTYREYKKRRMNCKLQIDKINKRKRIKEDSVLIGICGDGSVGGQLGVGNGSDTHIHNNISPFPFIMEGLLNKCNDICQVTTGIMSTAIVTSDNQIYVWGLNDKSELTINPQNANDVDVGDDDDELSNDIAWSRLYEYYYNKIELIYKKYNPNKLKKNNFIQNLLNKRKVGKIMMKYKGKQYVKEDVKEGSLYSQDNINEIVKQFQDRCKLNDKGSNKKHKATYTQEINIEKTAKGIQELYIAICNTYNISKEERTELYIPKATEDEIKDRRDRKLNPYKYLQQQKDTMDIDDTKKPDLISEDSENIGRKNTNRNGRHMLLRSDVTLNNENESFSDYEYEQKQDLRSEDDFQGTLSCSYWTPACIRLPYRMEIKQVTLGGTHMVVLDTLGQIWSSGTFMSDGPIGHHYDIHTKEIIRYQRTLCKIQDIESQDDGLSSSRIGKKNKKLPEISEIASGANHFLMLDVCGNIWKMGVTKLGQRWCSRNTKKYLCPQRVSVINIAQNKRATRRIKFEHISCGNHHNLAISTEQQLYSWGQNIWLQCGHSQDKSGYGNVVDQPRLVLFYKNKSNINNKLEQNIKLNEYPKIQKVCAGEHMTIALDVNGKVYTCGRNACGQLGRVTRSEGIKDYGIQKVQTEVKPDFMRQVSDLKHISIDWIGCGSVFWYGHNKSNGNVYGYGDSSNGRVGIGLWKYSRGRTVFDKHNFDLNKYKIIDASGGSDHCVFMIKKIKKKLHRRHSTISNVSNTNNNSRESSLDLMDNDTEYVTNKIGNLQTNNKMMPATHGPIKRKSRKRKLSSTFGGECIPENEEIMNENENRRKRRKMSKPALTKQYHVTSPSPGPPCKTKKMTK